jgi:general secretion pathway protein D
MENCSLRTTVAKISAQFAYRSLSRVDASADFGPNEKPKWSMLDDVLDRARVKVACELIVLDVIILVLCSFPLLAESANSDFKRGESAEAREDYDTAYDLYQKAVAMDSRDLIYKTALYRVKVSASGMHMSRGRKLLQGGDEEGALSEFIHAATIDPGNEAAQQEIAKIRKGRDGTPLQGETRLPINAAQDRKLKTMGAPVELKPVSNEPLTLHYSEDAKVVYQAIGKAAGINVLFDPDYTPKRIQLDLNNSSLLDALRIVGTMSDTFWRPVTPNTIFVAQNTRAKRTELEEQAVQTFYLSNAWQQNDLNDVQTALRNVLTNIKVYGVASQNALVVRGTPDELLLAQKVINDLDKSRPEVVVDIAVLEVSKSWERNLGITWPASASVGIAAVSTTGSGSSASSGSGSSGSGSSGSGSSNSNNNLTLYNLAHLNSNSYAVTLGTATANLLLTDSSTKILQNPRVRATDAQKATLTIGERIPVATGSYQTGAGTALVSSLVNTQFQYLDVGLKIEMTPSVHYDNDITLKIKIEVSSDANQVTISGVTEPIIAQNVVDQVIRLREGEASILGGIQTKQDQVSWAGIPGLSSIPILKYLFGSKDHQIMDNELVFLVVPHVVRAQTLDSENLRTIDTGTGQAVELRYVDASDADDSSSAPAPAPPGRPTPEAYSTVGIVPGEGTKAAAPAALAQLSATVDANGQPTANTLPPPLPSVPTGSPLSPGSIESGSVNLMFSPPGRSIAAGATFQVPIVLTGGKDIVSVPLQIQYDPAKLSLVNVTNGDLLSRDNQAVALVHLDDGHGSITIKAARPPGMAGISGAGVVCVLSFQAKTAGETRLSLTRAVAINSTQQQLLSKSSQVTIAVH